MSTFRWEDLLRQWSEEIAQCGDGEGDLATAMFTKDESPAAGATEDEISVAESRLGTTFPPSYRRFLQVANGCQLAYRRLRPASEVQWFAAEAQETIDLWTAFGLDDTVSDEEYLVYGDGVSQPLRAGYLQTALAIGDYDEGTYLLNPQTVTADGEWEAWFFAHWVSGADRYRSFWELMIAEHEAFLYTTRSSLGLPTPRADPGLGVDAEDLDGLLHALQNPHNRIAALQALGNLRDHRAFEPVLEILQNDHVDLFARECAARTLGELRDPRAVKPLIDMFRTPQTGISDSQLASLLRSGTHGTRDATLEKLLGSVSIQDMIDALEPLLGADLTSHLEATLTAESVGQGISERLLYACKQGLLGLGSIAQPALLDAVQDSNPTVRGHAASTLCYFRGRQEVFEGLLPAFDDPDPAVRGAVVANIEQLFDNRAVDPLLKALEDPDSTVRTHAARSLGIMAGRSDTDQITAALDAAGKHDADAGVRRAASQALDGICNRT